MKKIILTIALVSFGYFFSQETNEFKFTKNGFNDFIVSNAENKTKEELYKKTLEWISKTYKNPQQVIKSNVENNFIKIEGIEPNLLCLKNICSDIKYSIEISFKDGKYKFDIINIEQKMPEIGWTHFTGLEDGSFYFENNGTIKPKFKLYENLPKYFNNLNNELLKYLKEETTNNNW